MKAKHWLGIVAVVAFVGFLAWGRSNSALYYVPSTSMEPTIRMQDRIWADKWLYKKSAPQRDDIAIVNLPLSLVTPGMGNPGEKVDFVKRVVGLPGDRIEIVNGRLKLNRVWRKEPFAHWDGVYFYSFKIVGGKVYSREKSPGSQWSYKDTLGAEQMKISRSPSEPIPADKYLILGDNRSNSNDSHVFGLVDRDTFVGRVTRRLWPDPREF